MSSPIPIIVGVADIINRSLKSEDAIEPLGLMNMAVEKAVWDALEDEGDAGGMEGLGSEQGLMRMRKLIKEVDSVSVVRNWTWPYKDVCQGVVDGLEGLLVRGVDGEGEQREDGEEQDGREGKENNGMERRMREKGKRKKEKKKIYKEESEHGGNNPVRMLDEACRRVGKGDCNVAVVVGGEALGSLVSCVAKEGGYPKHWSPPAGDPRKILALSKGVETPATIHSIGLPIHIYPLYENAFRFHRHQSLSENTSESARLYAEFAQIAAGNEFAWNRDFARELGSDGDEVGRIAKVGKGNRMICWPYPLLMNAFNNVNMAAACIVTSTAFARELGIPEKKWIYPLGGAGMSEKGDFWERPNFYSSTALEKSLDKALEISGLGVGDVDLFDFYSCFPIVPKLAAHHLKIPILNPPKPITLLGGLTSFGGAGNNYSLHAITEMTRQLRKRKEDNKKSNGLILANGGVLTYQHVICLSSSSPDDGNVYQDHNPLPAIVDEEGPIMVHVLGEGFHEAVIETYTVQYSRQNAPETGFIIGRIKESGKRFIANAADEFTLRELVSGEVVGRSGWVWKERGDGKRNSFGFRRRGAVL